MDRAASIKFKLMLDGHIRGVQTQRKDLASAAEWMIYFTKVCSPTISVAHAPKLLITDNGILNALHGTKNNLLMLNFPYILSKRRSEEGKLIRRQYNNDIGVPYQACKQYQLNQSGTCDCITTFTTDNNIIEMTDNKPDMELTYHPNPTKEDLLEYFGPRIKIRKMTPRTALRLMDVDDSDIDKMMNATETVTLKNGTIKTKKAISKTYLYMLAGNSICVGCLYNIFRTMFIPNQPEGEIEEGTQMLLF